MTTKIATNILPTPGFPFFRTRHRAVPRFLWGRLISTSALVCFQAYITHYSHREFADHGASTFRQVDQQLSYCISFKLLSNLMHILCSERCSGEGLTWYSQDENAAAAYQGVPLRVSNLPNGWHPCDNTIYIERRMRSSNYPT